MPNATLAYTTYADVPWFRKNWFAILTGLFFSPALLPTLVSGDIYYERNGELRMYSMVARIILILWSAAGTWAIVGFVAEQIAAEPFAIYSVKSGSLQSCPNATLEKMANSFMSAPRWSSGEARDGTQLVNLAGEIQLFEQPATALVQFVVRPGSGAFEFRALEIDGKAQPEILALSLFSKMCESAR